MPTPNSDEVIDIMVKLNAARDRAALLSHDIGEWDQAGDEGPALRSELMNQAAIFGDFLGAMTNAMDWIVRVILHNATNND